MKRSGSTGGKNSGLVEQSREGALLFTRHREINRLAFREKQPWRMCVCVYFFFCVCVFFSGLVTNSLATSEPPTQSPSPMSQSNSTTSHTLNVPTAPAAFAPLPASAAQAAQAANFSNHTAFFPNQPIVLSFVRAEASRHVHRSVVAVRRAL